MNELKYNLYFTQLLIAIQENKDITELCKKIDKELNTTTEEDCKIIFLSQFTNNTIKLFKFDTIQEVENYIHNLQNWLNQIPCIASFIDIFQYSYIIQFIIMSKNYYPEIDLYCKDNILNSILDNLGNMRDDEIRARQQLEEIKAILKESKNKIKEYNLPIIPNNYFVELNEAQVAIKEIIKELDKKPITIEVLNTRVDTARDLVLKLFKTTKEMLKSARFAELAIVYGNRYRSEDNDLEKYLTYAEKLFYDGDYQKSLEITINALNKVEKGIYDKLLKLYSFDEDQKDYSFFFC